MERLGALGEQALLATTAAMLAQARYERGPHEEAESLSEVAERAAAREDLSTQGDLARCAGAGPRAPRPHEEAEALAREAVALVEPSDALTDQGDALLALAEILELRGRRPTRRPPRARRSRATGSKGATVRDGARRTTSRRRWTMPKSGSIAR